MNLLQQIEKNNEKMKEVYGDILNGEACDVYANKVLTECRISELQALDEWLEEKKCYQIADTIQESEGTFEPSETDIIKEVTYNQALTHVQEYIREIINKIK